MKADFDFEKPIAEIEEMIDKLRKLSGNHDKQYDHELHELEEKCARRKEEIYAGLTPWQTVQVARHSARPVFRDYIELMFSEFIELHGDRAYADDPALIGGFAALGETRIMAIGHNKGKNVDENMARNFGMARPDGYRKALRLMKLAVKYRLPVVTFIDTMGAFPGADAEERGQAEAIARNLMEMARIETPIVSVVLGEGGSGGALGIGVGDVNCMLSHAVYSVISPEGCASILWRDAAFAPQAAEALKLTAGSLKEMGIIDEIIPEPLGGAHRDYHAAVDAVKKSILGHIRRLSRVSPSRLLGKRFAKYSKMGIFAGKPGE